MMAGWNRSRSMHGHVRDESWNDGHAAGMFLRLCEGSDEPIEDQVSQPRRALAVLAVGLVAVFGPLSLARQAHAARKTGKIHYARESSVKARESGADDDESGPDPNATGGNGTGGGASAGAPSNTGGANHATGGNGTGGGASAGAPSNTGGAKATGGNGTGGGASAGAPSNTGGAKATG